LKSNILCGLRESFETEPMSESETDCETVTGTENPATVEGP